MSTAEDSPSTARLMEAPEFELECRYDDPADPSELTVFSPATRHLATEWMTADRSTVVPLDRVR